MRKRRLKNIRQESFNYPIQELLCSAYWLATNVSMDINSENMLKYRSSNMFVFEITPMATLYTIKSGLRNKP